MSEHFTRHDAEMVEAAAQMAENAVKAGCDKIILLAAAQLREISKKIAALVPR